MRYINVPMILQEKSMSCWHASARMLWGFKYKQSINPLSKLYYANSGATPAQFIELAKSLGLETVRRVTMTYTWVFLDGLLKQYGPLWVAGYWYGFPHIIVVTGAEQDGTVYVNDPGSGPKVHDMRFFNEKIAGDVMNPIMYLSDKKANRSGYERLFD